MARPARLRDWHAQIGRVGLTDHTKLEWLAWTSAGSFVHSADLQVGLSGLLMRQNCCTMRRGSALMTAKLSRRSALALLTALGLPVDLVSSAPTAQAPSPIDGIPKVPDLGNLHDTMAWLARENAPRLSFLDAKWRSLDAWKKTARPLFRQHLRYDPKPLPLAAEVVRREERDGLTIESVNIRATPAYDIPAKILFPSARRGRLPGVLALHCHSGQYVWAHEKAISSSSDAEPLIEFRDRVYGRPYAELLARRGYIVVVIEAFYFGERRLRAEALDPATALPDARDAIRSLPSLRGGSREWIAAVNRVCSLYETVTAKTIFAAGATWPGILAWDEARSLDYLCSRPDVDRERIGCVGLSLGGLRTAFLIAADPRVKAACVTGWMPEFAQLIRNYIRPHTWMAYIPGLYPSLDLPDAAALIAPGALLVQQCSRDNLYPMAAMRGGVNKLERIYAKAGIPERFRGSFHDEPHSFRPQMQDEAFEWLDRWV
jgi:dienelactone hydrolase